MNSHKGRNKITDAATRLYSVVCGSALGFPASFTPAPTLMISCLCNVLFEVQLPVLARSHGQAECTCDIEGRDGEAEPRKHGEWLETVVVQGDDGREDERHKGKRESVGEFTSPGTRLCPDCQIWNAPFNQQT